MHSDWHPVFGILIVASATIPGTCSAQEVASLDLTKVAARVDLRRPAATSDMPAGYSGAQSARYCGSAQKTGALHTSLVSLDRADYQVGEEARFEVTIQNVGSEPTQIPFSPHLADLQPSDPAEKFAYFQLEIALWIAGDGWSSTTGGAILYGSDNLAHTLLTLQPGEWVRVVAKGNLQLESNLVELSKSGFPADHVYATSTLFREETLVKPRNSATVATEVCLTETGEQGLPIQLTLQ
jgi:hypothetical protein